MFSVLKVRREQKRGDYSDPGWFQHPPGTVAREVGGAPLVYLDSAATSQKPQAVLTALLDEVYAQIFACRPAISSRIVAYATTIDDETIAVRLATLRRLCRE